MSLKIDRVFAVSPGIPESATFDCKVTASDGAVVFEQSGVQAPEGWSQLAVDIAASKYFRKDVGESSVYSLVNRIAKSIASEGLIRGYFDAANADRFDGELAALMLNQYAAFNSPVWFNCGLSSSYGIEGQGGNWAWDSESDTIIQTDDAYSRPQCSACFIQSVEDDLMSIYDLVKTEARLFKYGSGTGTNFSSIRGSNEKLSSGGTSSGLMSFLEVFDRMAGSTKSGGTTRRAAKMVCLDADHPEIREFVNWKVKEEEKAKALIDAGWDSDFNGEAYKTVSGQNSNNSVRLTDDFMERATATPVGQKWNLYNRTDGKVSDKVYASDLLDEIALAAWKTGDPGIHFTDTINRAHTCPEAGAINASNPCSEYLFIDDSACNLASLNLAKFEGTNGFDTERFQAAVRLLVIAQDILVDLSSYPTKKIAENSHKYRPIGVGYANLGAVIMARGLPYDSEDARTFARQTTRAMAVAAWTASAEIAGALGSCEGYSERSAAFNDAAYRQSGCIQPMSGFRNSQVTLLAPTGTIGLLMDCDTTGIEPEYALVKYKKLAGGGTVKIVNQAVRQGLESLGHRPEWIDRIIWHVECTGSIVESGVNQEDLPIFDCASESGGRCLSAEAHLKMMAAVQPYLSGAISKTVNLPNDATVADVRDLIVKAWEMGIKCLALYRDGCKACQPLNKVTSPEPANSTVETIAPPAGRRRLPKRRTGFTQEAIVGGQKIFLRTGEYEDGQLGEIFVDMHKEGAPFRSLMNCFAMLTSIALQHGVPLEDLVSQFTLTNFEPKGVVSGHPNVKLATSLVDYLFRVLAAEYLKDDDLCQVKLDDSEGQPEANTDDPSTTGDAPPCTNCGGQTQRNGTCYRCANCGESLGCS